LRLATIATTSWPSCPGRTIANVLATPFWRVGTLASTAAFAAALAAGSIVVRIV